MCEFCLISGAIYFVITIKSMDFTRKQTHTFLGVGFTTFLAFNVYYFICYMNKLIHYYNLYPSVDFAKASPNAF